MDESRSLYCVVVVNANEINLMRTLAHSRKNKNRNDSLPAAVFVVLMVVMVLVTIN